MVMPSLWAGTVRAFDAQAYEATVELRGYPATVLTRLPVAQHLRADLLHDGVRCVVLLFDELRATDGVVLALYGGAPAGDPAFDPQTGHRHRGLIGDGPEIV